MSNKLKLALGFLAVLYYLVTPNLTFAQTTSDMFCNMSTINSDSGVTFNLTIGFGDTQLPTAEQTALLPYIVSILNSQNQEVGQLSISLNMLECEYGGFGYLCASTQPITRSLSSLGISPETQDQTFTTKLDSHSGGVCNAESNFFVPATDASYPNCDQYGEFCHPVEDPIPNGVTCSDGGIIRSCCPLNREYNPGSGLCERSATRSVTSVDDYDLDELNPLLQFGNPAETGDLSTPAGIVSRFLNFIAFPLAGLILFVMIVWGGFEILSQSATKKSVDAGRQRITAAIIGFILLFSAYWIAQILEVIFGIQIL